MDKRILRRKIETLFVQEKESYFLLSGISLLWILVIWIFDPAYMILAFDDSFYYLKVASNVVGGYGATFDRINSTNGFHPLWMTITIALTALVGDHAPLLMRTVLTLQVAMVYAGTSLLAIGTPAAGRTVRIVTAVLLTNCYCFKIVVNGQESALQYFLMCLALHYWWQPMRQPRLSGLTGHLIFGVILGMMALARIEAVVFAAVLIAMPLLWPHPGETEDITKRLSSAVIRLSAFLVVVTPYIVWNLETQGHVLPVSAVIKMDWAPSIPLLARAVCLSAVLLALVIYWQLVEHSRVNHVVKQGARFVFPVLVYAAAESVASFIVSGAFMPPLWYMPPYLLLVIIVTTIVVKAYDNSITKYVLLCCLAGFYLIISAGFCMHRFDFRSYSFLLVYRDAGMWLSSHSPPHSLVASWDAGIMAAHSDRRFMNLDGLINSWDYKINYLDKGLTEKFITEKRVDYICQRFVPEELRTPLYRGVDLSNFYVAWLECVEHRQLINFLRKGVDGDSVWSKKPHYAIVLSREPLHGEKTFAEFVSEASLAGNERCIRSN